MQDELLIRFIDGTCTKEESEKVIEELSNDGNEATEWLQMLAAARLAGSKPVRSVLVAEAKRFVSETMERKIKKRAGYRRIIRLTSVATGLCAVAASIVIAVVVRTGNDGNNPESMNMNGLLASSRDSVIYAKPEAGEDRAGTREDKTGLEETKETINPEKPRKTQEYVDQESVPQSVVSITYDSHSSKDSVDGSQTKPGTLDAERKLEMIRPSKSPYRVKVENLSKDFVFEWRCDGGASARLVVIDRGKTVLVDKTAENPDQCRISIPITSITDKGELVWTLEIMFLDGSKASRTGRILLKSEID